MELFLWGQFFKFSNFDVRTFHFQTFEILVEFKYINYFVLLLNFVANNPRPKKRPNPGDHEIAKPLSVIDYYL